MKEQIQQMCKAGRSKKDVAAALNISIERLIQAIALHFPESKGRWTLLRKSFGLDPWQSFTIAPPTSMTKEEIAKRRQHLEEMFGPRVRSTV
jgi:hypothetical protein